ncbi:type VI secretion system protein [Corallococcus sp. BB11-1]|uniref:type VI secretion system protein n=1 Tax=Corallococcus sp. BB11-1 TaxID=2996783 RepID=UPI00226DD0F3|nr:type VI secretion system protein [Corallococcus sp. BB11-1]MCY1033889.1 type VI secretion system protein [Corallococcus sp. BB11-1]
MAFASLVPEALAALWRGGRRQPSGQNVPAEALKAPAPVASLARAPLTTALERLESTGTDLYQVPWCLLVGESDSGRSSLLSSLTSELPSARPDAEVANAAGWAFWFLEGGLVIDVKGGVFTEPSQRARLISHLEKARPLRPLDSVVLMLPAPELVSMRLSSEGAEAPLTPELWMRMEELHRALRALNDVLGVSCPIYVVITKADELTGFREFCQALPAEKRDQMFGWSNPHASQEKYDTGWVRGAIDSVYDELCGVQLALFARGGPVLAQEAARYQLFSFAESVRRLQDPLCGVLDRFFKGGLYDQPLWLRGIYFCGSPTGPVREGERAGRIAFAGELFEKKVFPEGGLARPSLRALKRNRQQVRILKVAVGGLLVLASLVMLGTWWSLRHDLKPLSNSVQAIAQRVEDAGRKLRLRQLEQLRPEANLEQTHGVLQEMSQIDGVDLSRPTLPTSLMSDLDDRLGKGMTLAFNRVVLESLRVKLEAEQEQLQEELRKQPRSKPREPRAPGLAVVLASAVEPSEAVTVEKVEKVESLELMPEFQALWRRIEGLKQYQQHSDAYAVLSRPADELAETKKVEALESLAQPLLNAPLPAAFHTRPHLYERWLAPAKARPLKGLPDMNLAVRERLELLAGKLQARLFEPTRNLLEVDARAVEDQVTRLRTATVSDLSLRSVATAIREVHHDLDLESVKWISSNELDPALLKLLKQVEQTPFLNREEAALLANHLRDNWLSELTHLRGRLRDDYAALALGPVLIVEAGKPIALGEPYLTLKQLLEDPIARTLSEEPKGPPPSLEGGPVRIFWNEEELEAALKRVEPYNAFVKLVTDKFQPETAQVLSARGKELFSLRVGDQVSRAVLTQGVPKPSSAGEQARAEIAAELDNLKRVSGKLLELLNLYSQLGLDGARLDLNRLIAFQAEGLLRRTDELLERDAPYAPDPRLARWSGERSSALEAFDVPDAQGLAAYLQVQRGRVGSLARDQAAIPVSLLTAVDEGASRPLVAKWQRILNELERREKMVPGNSVQVLESFIQTDMMTAGNDSCATARPPARSADGGDYFLGRLFLLRETLRRRCEGFEAQALRQAYERLGRAFNAKLAGRFPFSEDVPPGPRGELGLADVRAFFQEFDAFRATLGNAADQDGGSAPRLATGALSRERIAFLEQLEEARAFLLPLLREGDGPLYSVRMEPRVNRRRELRANQLIEWRLEAAGQRVAMKPEPWQPETPLLVVFRWAKDGPSAPLPDEGTTGARLLAPDTLGFRYEGPWSLIRLLRAHQTPRGELEGRRDSQPHTLRFLMRGQSRPRGGEDASTPAAEDVRAFLRVEVLGPDGRSSLFAPRAWPVRAPVSDEAAEQRRVTQRGQALP